MWFSASAALLSSLRRLHQQISCVELSLFLLPALVRSCCSAAFWTAFLLLGVQFWLWGSSDDRRRLVPAKKSNSESNTTTNIAGYLTLGFLGAAVQPVRLRQRHPECFSAGSSNDDHSDKQLVAAQQKQTGAACTATDGNSLAWPQL